ncbi:MAG: hypothetical protein H8E17_06975 [Deltaproteobacteria bacterium]|jgi:[methyl-Co(III) methanol-specific corrinoid protein]:coenzyme M methyltransferase|nr:hypothetical protein [Deltaproteobacteria bacterium]
MKNPLIQLIEKHKKGTRSTFHLGPFLSINLIKDKGMQFNAILQNPEDMAAAAMLNFELGFDTTVLPFDLNVEAEVLGAEVRYYDGYDGLPVYPTIKNKWVSEADDILIPANVEKQGRIPSIIRCIQTIKEKAAMQGAVGIFVPGPFTLAGQIMDLDELFIMILKRPDVAMGIFHRLTKFISILKEIYIHAGVDFIVIEEGGATSISPAAFKKLLLPYLKDVFAEKPIPHILSLTGNSNMFMELMLECKPDGIGVDQENDIKISRETVPENVPLFAVCGDYAMLAKETPEEVAKTVKTYLDMGVTSLSPPADIYPPAKPENIEAFLNAVRHYEG